MVEHLKPCPLCGQDMNYTSIHLWGRILTLTHTCISGIEMKIQGDSKYDVIRKWNTFVTVVEK